MEDQGGNTEDLAAPGTLVTLITPNYAAEALVIQSYLKSHGVWAEVASIHFHYVMPWMGLSLGGFQVNIRRSDAPRARELIEGVGKDWPLSTCLECGSADVELGQAVLRNLTTFLIGTMFATPYTGKRECRACGHKWIAHKPRFRYRYGVSFLLLLWGAATFADIYYWTRGP